MLTLRARIIIGVAPGRGAPPAFAAHAWLAHGDAVLSALFISLA